MSSSAANSDSPLTITVQSSQLHCDGTAGGEGHSLGHPRIYLNISASGKVACPYCGILYQLAAGAKPLASAH
ncbi:MAG: zinc-finger domain-containing protein [Candidatus Pacebacteria bacterium]|nr:zinc-finger domain-containing protein [Candidatus Paceibacterota bacterium]